GLRP
ncbi:hypothetical protein ACHAXH_009721, partial [Discostella pseudostelligera]